MHFCLAYAYSRISRITHGSLRSAIRRTTCKRVGENRFDTFSRGGLLAGREGEGRENPEAPFFPPKTCSSFSFLRATVDNWARTHEELSVFHRSLFLPLSCSHEIFRSDMRKRCTRMRHGCHAYKIIYARM